MNASQSANALEMIHQQVMWNRLIAVVEEQAQTILRTAFGSVVREAGDLSAGIYDLEGRMIAQAVTGTPGHVNTMARAVDHFLARFPVAGMKPGDVYVTNDPWLGTGHLFDFVVVSPAFAGDEPVALFASTCHVIDVGGRGFTAEGRSIYEEGIAIPHMKLRDRGRLNEDFFSILMANSRNPVEVKGDILSLVSCNDTGEARLRDMMAEFGLESIAPLADFIIGNSRDAMINAIGAVPERQLPDGHGIGRLRRAGVHQGRDEGFRRGNHYRLPRNITGVALRHQLAALLYGGLYRFRPQMHHRTVGAQQPRLVERVPGGGGGRLGRSPGSPQPRHGAPRHRPNAARYSVSAVFQALWRAEFPPKAPGASGFSPLPTPGQAPPAAPAPIRRFST